MLAFLACMCVHYMCAWCPPLELLLACVRTVWVLGIKLRLSERAPSMLHCCCLVSP